MKGGVRGEGRTQREKERGERGLNGKERESGVRERRKDQDRRKIERRSNLVSGRERKRKKEREKDKEQVRDKNTELRDDVMGAAEMKVLDLSIESAGS